MYGNFKKSKDWGLRLNPARYDTGSACVYLRVFVCLRICVSASVSLCVCVSVWTSV